DVLNEALVGWIVFSIGIERYPYFRPWLTQCWYQHFPATVADLFCFFNPSYIDALHGLDLRYIVMQSLENKLASPKRLNRSVCYVKVRTKPHQLYLRL